jgi:hypothetical protein
LLEKYRDQYPEENRQNISEKFSSHRLNFGKEIKRIDNSEKRCAGTEDFFRLRAENKSNGHISSIIIIMMSELQLIVAQRG